MPPRQIDGIDTHDFPDKLAGNPLFHWMGDDYVRYVVAEVRRLVRDDTPSSNLIAVRCEKFPLVEVGVRDDRKTVRKVIVLFELQLLMHEPTGPNTRIRGCIMFRAEGLDGVGPRSISANFEVETSEPVA